ncbi:hypothetical protein [Paracoccus aminophilus]|uniref:Uncharacterized protein n=1 Tax=Paracoccus aminophilus JCM 7686 TaxID=1367847 RepID=S5XXI3_PARAH|nr:hypothetical protein [Paracoccus aminophilus]AGT10002.1 hypothetical protein JCM7686_2966 [Paracoccus aminophilus JCM 7686]
MDEGFVLAPVRFFLNPNLLSGRGGVADCEVIRDLELAMQLENDQELPAGYAIWRDALEGAVSPFYATPEGQAGRALIEPEGEEVWDARGEFQRELNKKKIRKTITPFEEFWNTVAYGILETLQSVALARFVLGKKGEPLLERVFEAYQAGLYPCGLRRDGQLVALDPSALEGFDPAVVKVS